MLKGIFIIIFLPVILVGMLFKGFFKVFLGLSGVVMGFGALKTWNRQVDNDYCLKMAELSLDNLRHTQIGETPADITSSLPRHLRKRKARR
jgi:hypothetical protein